MSIETAQIEVDKTLLLNEEEMNFVQRYQHEDISQLSLNLKLNPGQKDLLSQIARRQKINNKLPFFYDNPQIHYPGQISLEQCSSEVTARFKSTLVAGNTMIDLTAGMGIDTYFAGQNFEQVIMVEASEALAAITSHNLATFPDAAKFRIAKGVSAESFISEYDGIADLIYIDPSRRNVSGGKVFHLNDCEPDVLTLLPRMLDIANRILIKTSPLLDISLACRQLQHVRNVYVIEWMGECRELLFEVIKDYQESYKIHAVNLDHPIEFSFNATAEREGRASFSMPLKFLYEPCASILKAGAFITVQHRFAVYKLHPHSHLYTSDEYVPDFPGRTFSVENVSKLSRSGMQDAVPEKKANITVRNFPASVAELRKKWGIAEGGDVYVFATTLYNNEKAAIVCKKY